MPFSSSPVTYPCTSSPSITGQKRKLFQSWDAQVPEKQMTRGGFILDEEDEEDLVAENLKQGLMRSVESDGRSDSLPSKKSCPGLTESSPLSRSPSLPPLQWKQNPIGRCVEIRTSLGKSVNITFRPKSMQLSYQQTIAQRSTTDPVRAKKAYYGIDIHKLMDEHNALPGPVTGPDKAQEPHNLLKSVEEPVDSASTCKSGKSQMWTEKYRARKFTDLTWR